MMSDREVIQAADSVEVALECLMELGSVSDMRTKIYGDVYNLQVHNGEDPDVSHVLLNNSDNSYGASYSGEFIYNSVNVGLFTWLQYNINSRAKHTSNTMLRTHSNNCSIVMSTNAGSNDISKIKRTQLNEVFEMQKLGTPECSEYLFLRSLEQDDFTMNALMFQYEWRRRYGMNIVLRIGKDPVQTCSNIEQIARDAYEKTLGRSFDSQIN